MLIIIPAYNEEQNISRVIEGCRRWGSVVVVDDGSTDQTGHNAELAGAIVLWRARNFGYADALDVGYRYALARGYQYIVQIDADGQHDPRCIPRLCRPVVEGACDIAIGSRFLAGHYQPGFYKSIGMLVFRHLVYRLTGLEITDTTSGYQCLNSKAMEYHINQPVCKYPDANAIIRAHRAGLRIQEVPVIMHPNTHRPGMHRGAINMIRYMRIVLGDIYRIRTIVLK